MAHLLRITSLLFVVLSLSCSPIVPPGSQCSVDPDCGESLVCDRGTCVAQPEGSCRSDETRPCGPEAIGACRPGLQRCVEGVFETNCPDAVTATSETCNAIDDDCDGVVDDGVTRTFFVDRDGDGFGSNGAGAETRQACSPPVGFVAFDTDCDDTNSSISPTAVESCDPSVLDEDCDGMANEGCGCSNIGASQVCCAGRGSQTCEAANGGSVLSACTVMPTLEVCNGLDDDCDGNADELYSVTNPDGGRLTSNDGGIIELDGGCSAGVGACARTSGTACIGGSLSCLATAGTPSIELCNSIDDDCDGQTDEASTSLCPATGQTCALGNCECPAGQSVCGSSCQSLSGSCSVGVGACIRTGVIACISGGASCDAMAGTPVAETCDGVDNDCNGTIDNGVTITCYPDGDNDRYASSTIASQQCPNSARAAFGNCPTGFVSPAASAGIDCDPANGSLYRMVSTRADGDNDAYCQGAATTVCVGATAPAGQRFTTSCAATDDCNDASASLWSPASTRADGDGDTYCVGSASVSCLGATAPSGRRFTGQCAAGPDDCADAISSQYINTTVRTDGDGDGYCIGAAFPQCGNGAAQAGTRAASTCNATNDCKDTNPFATSFCSIINGYQTASATKQCGIGFPPSASFLLSPTLLCPTGFSRVSATSNFIGGDGGGRCTATSDVNLTMECNTLTFGSYSCQIVGNCVAN